MTREEAIKAVGQEAVEKVERENCDFTNRLTDGTEWMGWTEFAAWIDIDDERKLGAFYYQKKEDVDAVEDLGDLIWDIDHYEVF